VQADVYEWHYALLVVHAGTAEEEKDAGYTHILHNGPEKDKSKKTVHFPGRFQARG